MHIGIIGLGKLGLPCALEIERCGHKVRGYDINPEIAEILKSRILPYKEVLADVYLAHHNIELCNMEDTVVNSDIIFVAVQTPHDPMYEGVTRIPEETCDFDYSYLLNSLQEISDIVQKHQTEKIVVIISTVLPGTIQSLVLPIISPLIHLCYNPFFIAMGTTIDDFKNPEFVLLGCEHDATAKTVSTFYNTIHDSPVFTTSIFNAELIKVSYNTFIGMKITFANTLMEICHKMGGDIDDVTRALSMATTRVISPKYMSGGMGDGGGCHPRDNIALSFLSEKLNLSFDYFHQMMTAREKQTEWLADLICENCENLPIVILGKAFKPETNLTVGSPSILLKNILQERGLKPEMYDPYLDYSPNNPDTLLEFSEPALFFVGTKHEVFADMKLPPGSIVLDPWRYRKHQDEVVLLSIGQTQKRR